MPEILYYWMKLLSILKISVQGGLTSNLCVNFFYSWNEAIHACTGVLKTVNSPGHVLNVSYTCWCSCSCSSYIMSVFAGNPYAYHWQQISAPQDSHGYMEGKDTRRVILTKVRFNDLINYFMTPSPNGAFQWAITTVIPSPFSFNIGQELSTWHARGNLFLLSSIPYIHVAQVVQLNWTIIQSLDHTDFTIPGTSLYRTH